MSKINEPVANPCQIPVYQIRVKGQLNAEWTDWFDGMTVTLVENGDTLLAGPVFDQSALYGLLKKIRDLGMPLVSVNCLDQGTDEKTKGNRS
jgi:hypothetical protein